MEKKRERDREGGGGEGKMSLLLTSSFTVMRYHYQLWLLYLL